MKCIKIFQKHLIHYLDLLFKKINEASALMFVVTYAVLSASSFVASYVIRFDNGLPLEYRGQMYRLLPVVILFQTFVMIFLGQANILPKFYSVVDLRSQVIAAIISSPGLFYGLQIFGENIPRGVRALNLMIWFLCVTFIRLALRYQGERGYNLVSQTDNNTDSRQDSAAIVGAGDIGASLVRELLLRQNLKVKPTAIFDDDEKKWGKSLHGVPIVGQPELLSVYPWNQRFRRVILAIPRANQSRIREITKIASSIGLIAETVPSLEQLLSGFVKVSQVRPVQIEDLLRRPPVQLDHTGIKKCIYQRVILVTGAGGSIGSELCRQILDHRPNVVVLVDNSEMSLFQVEQELLQKSGDTLIVPVLADIKDLSKVRAVFEKYRPNVVFHAAAYKHVPMMESHPVEAVRNNTFGTANVVRVASEFGVDQFVMISTDKAINPTNVMGASKRLAELFLQAYCAKALGGTRFMAVRFGNVLGSSGSVVLTFQKQIVSGGPVTVTHPDVTRFFMTIPEAVGLVLQAGALGSGGEIFVLDMGQPVKIADLARTMVELSGFKLGRDIKIEYIGLRPGEKMYEELFHGKEQLQKTLHPKILKLASSPLEFSSLEKQLSELSEVVSNGDATAIKCALRQIIPEYKPMSEI